MKDILTHNSVGIGSLHRNYELYLINTALFLNLCIHLFLLVILCIPGGAFTFWARFMNIRERL